MRVSQTTLVIAPLLIVGLGMPALAQSAALTNYPACTSHPSASDSEAAHSAYNLGKRFFDEADYTTAIHNFADAYKLDCTKPELLLNIARANELLANRAEAVHALETYLQRATNASADEKAQLQRRIDNLKALIKPDTTATAPTAVPTPLPVPTSTPAPTATTPPPPPPPEGRHHTLLPWVIVGVGGAAAIAGVVTYFVGSGDISTATTQCGGSTNPCNVHPAPPTAAGLVSTGNSLESAGGIMFYAGLGIAVGGVLWHFLEPTGPAPAGEAPKTSLMPSFTPVVGPGYTGASLLGRF